MSAPGADLMVHDKEHQSAASPESGRSFHLGSPVHQDIIFKLQPHFIPAYCSLLMKVYAFNSVTFSAPGPDLNQFSKRYHALQALRRLVPSEKKLVSKQLY